HIYTLSLHDALPISRAGPDCAISTDCRRWRESCTTRVSRGRSHRSPIGLRYAVPERKCPRSTMRIPVWLLLSAALVVSPAAADRSEEHTSELQSRSD